MSIFLETKRLILKTTELSDFDMLMALRSDPEVIKYLSDGSAQTEDEVRKFLNMAIPGMLAKPVIDIQIAIDSLSCIKQPAIDALKAIGYEYWHENPDPERMFFVNCRHY